VNSDSKSWNPGTPGLKVRLRDNPGRQGTTTGHTKKVGTFVMVEVDFGPNEKQFKRYDVLEFVADQKELFDLLAAGTFGGPSDLRRVLTFEKIKGELTNIFYSMEASNTDFYAHQFKPVMRFIESPVGRMLIADEVGLGKTIEAIYIWKEIQTRESARRLLIVCPAMLREKWRSDLRKRFNISGEIVSAKDLVERIDEIAQRRLTDPFVYITSLEGLRTPPNFEDETVPSIRARFARTLDQNTAAEEFSLFDLVIIDEAHYLRNPSTGNNRLGRLLREASRHLILLTATPIQIGSDNLYQLLRLIDPDQFYDSLLFQGMLSANSHVVRAQRALWQHPPAVADATAALKDAAASDYFRQDAVLARINESLCEAADDPERRVEILRLLESRSLLSQYMTRSRKREVLGKRVERAPQVLNVVFGASEAAIYKHVTERIRDQAIGKTGVSLFSLIARQRQMASSIVGALESWHEKSFLEELLWEDLGVLGDGSDDNGKVLATSTEEESDSPVAYGFRYDIAALERVDAKYVALIGFLKRQLTQDPHEKFVIFAFYRGTLKYLARRLVVDGVRAALMMGNMGKEKDDIIRQFSMLDGPSVLLSSEVGSEGIDLQFCRFLVNYDLPWNPMRVEQRIGRLDRLGQKAERISIINLAVTNTIEDRVLMRLYDRINVFRESIGDIEEILGEITENVLVDLLKPNLTDDERERNSMHAELAIRNTQSHQQELEQQAVNLVGFSDYILEHIQDSRQRGHWLSAHELRSLVDDFFGLKYPGTKIESAEPEQSAKISLSDDAQRSLEYFISDKQPATRTSLHRSSRPILCIFDARRAQESRASVEFIEPSHPLIQWIRSNYEDDQTQLHRVVAVTLQASHTALRPGDYVFSAHRWSFNGLKSDQLLAFRAIRLGESQVMSGADSEALLAAASQHGASLRNAINVLPKIDGICAAAFACEEALADALGDRLADVEAENTIRCNQQETSARKFTERRLEDLNRRLDKFRSEHNLRPVAMTEGLIRKEDEQLKAKINRLSRRRHVDPTMVQLALGVIRVI
jgi:superfamily II DNA or RNA helicase